MAIIQDIEMKSKKTKMGYIAIITVLSIFAVVQVLPLLWLGIGTFKTNEELISAIPSFLPKKATLDGYIEAFSKYHIWENIYNTVYIAFFIIVLQTTTSTLAAYTLSKIKPKIGNFAYMLLLGTQMISVTVLLFPTYILMSKWGLIGSKWSWILSSSAWGYAVVLYKNFFDNIPSELLEAAEIDGAGHFRKIISVIFPLAKPVYAVCILNTFMAVYNDFVFPLMILPNEKDWTLMIRIFRLQEGGTAPLNVMYVLLFVTAIPIILFYLIAQKQLQQGVATSGLKG